MKPRETIAEPPAPLGVPFDCPACGAPVTEPSEEPCSHCRAREHTLGADFKRARAYIPLLLVKPPDTSNTWRDQRAARPTRSRNGGA